MGGTSGRAVGFVAVAAGLVVVVGLAACSEGTSDADKAPVVAGTAGRQRFVVTLAGATPDLGEYRKLLKENPADVPAYVEGRRAALVLPALDAALTGFNGRVVERWWMSGQLTVEIPPEGVASLRAVPGVSAIEPDAPLR
jgi:hypothetical protein